MSGRGAQGRKAIKKNIEKHEKKKEAKDFADELNKPPSESGWSLPIRGPAASTPNHGRRASFSASVSTHSSGQSKGSDKARAATPSTYSAESKERYHAKGKETAHPRGRGGGVPTKASAANAPTAHSNASYELDPTSPAGAPPALSAQEKIWANMKVWHGNGQPTRRWRGFEHDSDMFTLSGDCLVYFSEDNNSHSEPRPMIRVHTEKLQEARSSFLSNLVMYGEIEQDEYSPPPSVAGSAGSPPDYPLTSSNLGYLDENTAASPKDYTDRGMASPPRNVSSRLARSPDSRCGHRMLREMRIAAFPTPPRSRTQSDVASSADLSNQEAEVTHEIWFPAPSYIKTAHAQRRHHLATRNFLALLYNKPIVGTDLFEMLSELQMVMDIMYELNEPNRRPNTAAMIVDYVVGRRLDDVRGSLTNALSLLAWSEKLDVGWDQGYLESFIHAVGMMARNTFDRIEYRRLSPVTRHNLEKAYNGMQIKMLNAEEKLSSFDFPEIWHLPNVAANSPALKSSEAFREYLLGYLSHVYEQWPPKANQHGHWLTRELVHRLQHDFGALYDVLVNRDIIWNDCEERHTRKWEMASRTALTDIFSPDLPGMPITDMLISFDNQHGYLHIPHPYPLLPRRVPSLVPAPAKKSRFGIPKKDKTSPRDPSEQMKISLAFGDATNINKLGMTLEANDLRDQFLEYEKQIASADLRDVPAADARLGRWILLYGILQVLSTLSVDTAGIRHEAGVPYFLCPSLENCPPWPPARALSDPHRRAPAEASQRASHCWTAPLRWDGGGGGGGGAASAPAELGSGSSAAQLLGRSAAANGPADGSALVSELDGDMLLGARDRQLRRAHHEKLVLQRQQQQQYAEYELRYRDADKKDSARRPDVPIRSPLRSPQRQAGREKEKDEVVEEEEEEEGGGADGVVEKKEVVPGRKLEYLDDAGEGKRGGEFLPGYAR